MSERNLLSRYRCNLGAFSPDKMGEWYEFDAYNDQDAMRKVGTIGRELLYVLVDDKWERVIPPRG